RMDVSNVLRKARAAAVVVHHHLQEVRIVAELGVILLRAVERCKRIVVPDMPADPLRWGDTLRQPIQVPVGVAEPLVPQSLPREQLWILDQQAPERHECAVGGSLPGAQRRGPALQRLIAVPRALDVDPFLARGSETVGAEAGDHAARARAAVARAEGVVERALAFAPPH